MLKQTAYTVSQLNGYIKSLFEGDKVLTSVFMSGEISNFTDHYASGHLYFSLKDERASIKAVMFASSAKRLRFTPRDGMNVIVRGRVSVYEASGQYQFYVEDMQPAGLGALSLAFEQLKEKLSKEGLFDPDRKRPLPPYPEKIGVVTSPSGAAVHDILSVLSRRFPLAEVLFCPVAVQGNEAAPQIVAALEALNRDGGAQVIIVGRGGGSMEDLWAFNEEIVARTVAASSIPVISAVGHETDFTICDFVADLRAPTPSAAAELAVPDYGEVMADISGLHAYMGQSLRENINNARQRLDLLTASPAFRSPVYAAQQAKQRLESLRAGMAAAMAARLSLEKARLAATAGRLDALSPLGVLSRGYAIAQTTDGRVLTDSGQTVPGDSIHVTLHRGTLECTVNHMTKRGNR